MTRRGSGAAAGVLLCKVPAGPRVKLTSNGLMFRRRELGPDGWKHAVLETPKLKVWMELACHCEGGGQTLEVGVGGRKHVISIKARQEDPAVSSSCVESQNQGWTHRGLAWAVVGLSSCSPLGGWATEARTDTCVLLI